MTFAEWHKQHAKYMEPEDIVAWCAEAWMAGFDEAIKQTELTNLTDENFPEVFK